MQETWAIHGVYPAMAWTPDDRAVVFWAGGKIRRVDVETGAASVIPFRVKATHRPAQALRFTVPAEPERCAGAHAALGAGLAARRQGGLRGARPPLDPRPAGGHAAPADDAGGALRAATRRGRATGGRWSTPRGTTRRWAASASRASPAATARVVTNEPGHYIEPAPVARRLAGGVPEGLRRLRHQPPSGRRRRASTRAPAGGGRAHPRHPERPPAAFRRAERPGLPARGTERGGQAGAGQRRPGRQRRARAPPERHGHRVPRLAGRALGGLPRGLQRLRGAFRPHGPAPGHRTEVQGRPGGAGLEGRRRVPALVRRQPEALLVPGAGALHAGPHGGVRVRGGRPREAAGGSRAGARHRLLRADAHTLRRGGARGRPRRHHEGRRGHRGRRRPGRRPSGSRRSARGRRWRCRRGRASSTPRARRSCPASWTSTGTAARATSSHARSRTGCTTRAWPSA